MILTLSAYAAKEALTAGVLLWGAVGRAQLVDARGRGQRGENWPKLAVLIAHFVLGARLMREGEAGGDYEYQPALYADIALLFDPPAMLGPAKLGDRREAARASGDIADPL